MNHTPMLEIPQCESCKTDAIYDVPVRGPGSIWAYLCRGCFQELPQSAQKYAEKVGSKLIRGR